MTAYDFIFYAFSGTIIGSSVVCVLHPNILYAGLSLFGAFFGVAGIYVLLGADFLAATQVLIYVGGILTLILFAVMLSKNIYGVKFEEEKKRKIVPTLFCLILLGFLVKFIFSAHWNITTLDEPLNEPMISTTSRLGTLLLTDYLLPFELASILLLAALIGAIVLARSRS